MKIKEGMVLSQVGDEYVAVPVGEQYKNFYGVVQLNHTGAVVWKGLESGLSREEIADDILNKFSEVNKERALASVDHVIQVLTDEGFLE